MILNLVVLFVNVFIYNLSCFTFFYQQKNKDNKTYGTNTIMWFFCDKIYIIEIQLFCKKCQVMV